MYYPKAYEPAPSKDNTNISIDNTIIIFFVFMGSILFLACIPTFCKIRDRRHEVVLLESRARMPRIEVFEFEDNQEITQVIVESPDNHICIGKI